MPNLKSTPEDTIAELEREAAAAVAHVERTAERLITEVKEVAAFDRDPIASHVITKADVAGYIDFEMQSSSYSSTQLQVCFGGIPMGYIQLTRPLEAGRYRALVLIDRLGDLRSGG